MEEVRTEDQQTDLPPHIQDALKAIGQLHADHARRATIYDKVTERVTSWIARPRFIAWLLAFVGIWVAFNAAMAAGRHTQFDPPPYNWLQGLLACVAVAFTSLILATQRRADELSSSRVQLALELAILSELRGAKIIHLIEELRRDLPNVRDREDLEAQAMATPADPAIVLEALEQVSEAAF